MDAIGEESTTPAIVAATVGSGESGAAGTLHRTFLITDIEGSTRLWEERSDAMGSALAVHDHLLRTVITDHRGTIVKTTGDGLLAVFADATAAIEAAIAAQRAIGSTAWGDVGQIRVRMAIHAGLAETRDGDWFGPPVNRAARILGTASGGQIVASAAAATVAGPKLPSELALRDLGSHRLRDLDRPEHLFQVLATDLPSEFPPLRSLSSRRSNLPVQLTSFVGRDRELSDLEALLADHRLVTLVGTGGTGKTRLMLQAAERVIDRFRDGVWLAELAPLGDPAQIPSEIARALGTPELVGESSLATVAAFVRDKELLLLLDNAEHLIDGVADVAQRLLGEAVGLYLMTTSREALAVPGEAVLQLQSLSCPVPGHRLTMPDDPGRDDVTEAIGTDAVRLFVERAAAIDPGFQLDTTNVSDVGEICRRLDGIPLAIELAAARVSSMSTGDIARRLGDRFRLLAGGRRTAVPRQQTLHALIDWSWDLLTDSDRQLLRRLSIFSGGWTVQTAGPVVGDEGQPSDAADLADRLARLVARSLVVVDRGAATRYRMLETIRQYAREKLIEAGEVAALADRHGAEFAALAIEAEPGLRGPAMIDWLDRLDAEAENLGSALEWALEAAPWQAVQMTVGLLAYWTVRVASSDNEARILAAIEIARDRAHAADATPAEKSLAARLLGEAARIWAMSGRARVAEDWATDAMDMARASGDDRAVVAAEAGVGITRVFSGHQGNIQPLFEDVVGRAERAEIWWVAGLAGAFAGAGMANWDLAAGEAMFRRGEASARRSGSPHVIGAVALARGRILGRSLRTDEALEQFAVAIARFAELGDERLGLAARSDVAHALRRGGRLDEAMAVYRETIAGWIRLGQRGAIANQIENVAFLEVARGRHERAARLLGAAGAIREAAGAAMAPEEVGEWEEFVAGLDVALPAIDLERARAGGRAMSQPDAIALAVGA